MLTLILNAIILLALSFILYIVAKTLPRVEESPEGAPTVKEHWVGKRIEKVDVWIRSASEKFLRRLRVWLLRLDNYVGKKLTSFRRDEKREGKTMMVESDKKEGENNDSQM